MKLTFVKLARPAQIGGTMQSSLNSSSFSLTFGQGLITVTPLRGGLSVLVPMSNVDYFQAEPEATLAPKKEAK